MMNYLLISYICRIILSFVVNFVLGVFGEKLMVPSFSFMFFGVMLQLLAYILHGVKKYSFEGLCLQDTNTIKHYLCDYQKLLSNLTNHCKACLWIAHLPKRSNNFFRCTSEYNQQRSELHCKCSSAAANSMPSMRRLLLSQRPFPGRCVWK